MEQHDKTNARGRVAHPKVRSRQRRTHHSGRSGLTAVPSRVPQSDGMSGGGAARHRGKRGDSLNEASSGRRALQSEHEWPPQIVDREPGGNPARHSMPPPSARPRCEAGIPDDPVDLDAPDPYDGMLAADVEGMRP